MTEKYNLEKIHFLCISNTCCRVKRQMQADRNMFMKTTRGWTDIRQEQLDVSSLARPDLKEVLDVGYLNGTSGELSLSRTKRGVFEYLYDVFSRWVGFSWSLRFVISRLVTIQTF